VIPEHHEVFDRKLTPALNFLQSSSAVEEKQSLGVPADKCGIALDDESGKLLVCMLQTNDPNAVEYHRLGFKDQKTFYDARALEIKNLLDLGAYRLMSLEESLKFREDHPDSVLPSKWVERWKTTDEGGYKAKSRIVILGFKDPHVLQLERSAPTPTNEAFTVTMQNLASLKRAAWSSDIKNAFGQSRKTTRSQRLGAGLPSGLAEILGCDSRQVLSCETEVYGLISGPSWLRQSLVSDFEAMGYHRNPYDKCMMMLPSEDSNFVINEGVILIEVDDTLEGGSAIHRKRMEIFYDKYKCGKKK
jgi:hypothetical protein